MGKLEDLAYYIYISMLFIGGAWSCDTNAVQQCSTTAFGEDGPPNFVGIPTSDRLPSICSKYRSYKTCLEPLLTTCEDTLDRMSRWVYTIGTDMCGSQYDDILKQSGCFDQDSIQNSMESCAKSTIINIQGPTPDCSGMQTVKDCMQKAVKTTCGQESWTLLNSQFMNAFSALTYPQTCDWNSAAAFAPRIVNLAIALLAIMTLTRVL